MRVRLAIGVLAAALLLAAFAPAVAQPKDKSLTFRLGIPTDTLVNIEDLYYWGMAVDLGFTMQAGPRLVLGGMANFGWSFGKSPYVPQEKLQAGALLKLGYGRLDGFSVSLLGGAVYFIEENGMLIPGLGLEFGYRFLSLGLSTASVGLGASLKL